jgi:hypothetical protein
MIDAHAHHNNGATCPLPLLYAQVRDGLGNIPVINNFVEAGPYQWPRWLIELAVTLEFSVGADIQKLHTTEMGGLLVELNSRMYIGKNIKFNDVHEHYKKLSKINEEKRKLLKGREPKKLNDDEQKKLKTLEKRKAELKDKMLDDALKIIPSLVIVPTMDMELAHLDGYGYGGKFIYRHDGKKVFYDRKISLSETQKHNISHERKSAREIKTEQEIQRKVLDEDDVLKFQNWKRQIADTEAAAAGNPLRHFPLFFYDPRRYRYSSGTNVSKITKNLGRWDDPFARIVGLTHKTEGVEEMNRVWIGFKMYPSLGYRPDDNLCGYLQSFYKECNTNHIPILTHCAPGGMTTHDAPLYRDYDRSVYRYGNTNNNIDETEMDYFFNTYAHPECWRPVLEKNKELHLCLAHFGGDGEWGHESMTEWANGSSSDSPLREWIHSILELTYKYDNVYTDISCLNIFNGKIRSNLKCMLALINEQSLTDTKQRFAQILLNGDKVDNPFKHLKNKLIFGSDWYLTYLTPIAKPDAITAQYDKYCNEFKTLFDEVDRTGELWEHVSLLNPWKCYSLSIKKFEDMRKILPSLASEMKVELKSGAECETFKKLKELYCDHIKKKLNPQDPCEYESTCRKDLKPCK